MLPHPCPAGVRARSLLTFPRARSAGPVLHVAPHRQQHTLRQGSHVETRGGRLLFPVFLGTTQHSPASQIPRAATLQPFHSFATNAFRARHFPLPRQSETWRCAKDRLGQSGSRLASSSSPVSGPGAPAPSKHEGKKMSSKRKRWMKDTYDGGPLQVSSDEADTLLQLKKDMKVHASELGLGPTAVTSSQPSARLPQFEEWIQAGYNGEMGFLGREDRMERRKDLNKILPGVQSVIVTSLVYWPGQHAFPPEQNDAGRGCVSSYAWGADYHELLGGKLRALAQWLHARSGGVGKWYVDTGAVMERDLGERGGSAGLGFTGKNSLLIGRRLGSGFFIGEILSTLPLPPDDPKKHRAGCGKCSQCLDGCPTDAFVRPYVLDARRCISYLTIEHKGPIPEELRPLMGNKVYGCDVCQQVCPWNKFEWGDVAGSPLFGAVTADVAAPRLAELLALDDEGFRRRFAGTAIVRIGVKRMVRNAAVAAGNSASPALLGPLRQALAAWEGEDETVVEQLQWSIRRLEALADQEHA